MAVLTASGIIFSDGTVGNSRANFFGPSGTTVLFFRASAPTFWTQVTTHNNKALRVVSGTGGGSGGVNTFTGTFASRSFSATAPVTINGLAVQGRSLSINEIPVHAHPANCGGNVATSTTPAAVTVVNPGGATGNNGGGGAHGHPSGYSSASGPWSSSFDMRVQYVDVILCSFNG